MLFSSAPRGVDKIQVFADGESKFLLIASLSAAFFFIASAILMFQTAAIGGTKKLILCIVATCVIGYIWAFLTYGLIEIFGYVPITLASILTFHKAVNCTFATNYKEDLMSMNIIVCEIFVHASLLLFCFGLLLGINELYRKELLKSSIHPLDFCPWNKL